jgi:hypothetical protein
LGHDLIRVLPDVLIDGKTLASIPTRYIEKILAVYQFADVTTPAFFGNTRISFKIMEQKKGIDRPKKSFSIKLVSFLSHDKVVLVQPFNFMVPPAYGHPFLTNEGSNMCSPII